MSLLRSYSSLYRSHLLTRWCFKAEWEGAYGEDNEEDDEHGGWLDISDDDYNEGEEGDEEGVEDPEQYSKDYQEEDDFFDDAKLFAGLHALA